MFAGGGRRERWYDMDPSGKKKKTFNKITENVGKTSNIFCIRCATCVHLQMKGRQKRIIGNMFGIIFYV
jgi:hypothetical protein